MVALKTDGIWKAINRFGTPWPPFDFQSGMGLVEIERSEADALRLLRRENALLKEENLILKKAAVILGTRTQPNSAL